MKVIADIRLYKSSGSDHCSAISNKALNLSVHRVVMKLREHGFSLGAYDHLYLNFTTLKPEGSIKLKNSIDRYHPWYRYCDVGISQKEYGNLENADSSDFFFDKIKLVLLDLFDAQNVIDASFSEAKKGPEMFMRYKEKISANGVAAVYLKLLDNGNYLPLLCVNDRSGKEIFQAYLPETIDLNIIGEIQLNRQKVTVKPRKNSFTKELQPISFEIKL